MKKYEDLPFNVGIHILNTPIIYNTPIYNVYLPIQLIVTFNGRLNVLTISKGFEKTFLQHATFLSQDLYFFSQENHSCN